MMSFKLLKGKIIYLHFPRSKNFET